MFVFVTLPGDEKRQQNKHIEYIGYPIYSASVTHVTKRLLKFKEASSVSLPDDAQEHAKYSILLVMLVLVSCHFIKFDSIFWSLALGAENFL